jgi:hypothetical protein
MRDIIFTRHFFFDKECKKHSHSVKWGIGIKGASFTSPATNNFASHYIDCQYTGMIDIYGMKIFEGDLLRDNMAHGDFAEDIVQVKFEDGMFCYPNYGILSPLSECVATCEIVGNVYTQKNNQL